VGQGGWLAGWLAEVCVEALRRGSPAPPRGVVGCAPLQEADTGVGAAVTAVAAKLEPLQSAWEAELQRLQEAEERRASLLVELGVIEKKAANLQ